MADLIGPFTLLTFVSFVAGASHYLGLHSRVHIKYAIRA